RNPGVALVVGGYHASARPSDFLNLPDSPLEEASPFDHAVVGEGEAPFTRIVEAALRGERLPEGVLGPEPVMDLDTLPPTDWSLLERYRPVASQQVTLYFSRGCPYGCSFCMERSKGETAWRAWSPARAERELLAFDAWLGLRDRKLFVSDPVFGLDAAWRREMLERLAQLDLGLSKVWLLTRVDLIGPGDVERYHRANVGIGLGLESGDPDMLTLMHKASNAERFHAKFRDLAARAGAVGLPWGANLIAGHPGETAERLERSAQFTADLFLGADRLTGFLSVDPFRFYPGSPVDRRLDDYAERFGTRVHRPRWWNYSEQAFTSEWVDPSSALDYRRREALTARLFGPIADGIAERFAYNGPAADYFRRSVTRSQAELAPATRLRTMASYHLWRRLTGSEASRLTDDAEAAPLFRQARADSLAHIEETWDTPIAPRLRDALLDEPRERYAPEEHAADSWRDVALPLLDDDSSTLSALHAYVVNYTLVDLREGDCLLEVGTGTGYGAAIAARVVGENGGVATFEVNTALADQARENLRSYANVSVRCGNALAETELPPFNKALFTCAVGRVPDAYLEALPEGGRIAAPLTTEDGEQELTLIERTDGELVITEHGPVRYVPGVTT
ncbi:radical SAM protein, partial [bacterium]|nr:radical SAM protein [bacterium]